MDLLFAISTTATESEENLVYSKKVIYKIVEKYGIKKIKYSLLTFGQEPYVHFKFNFVPRDVNALKAAIEKGQMESSGASLQNALEKSRELFEEANGWYLF